MEEMKIIDLLSEVKSCIKEKYKQNIMNAFVISSLKSKNLNKNSID
jgi:hypothetical protein